MNMMFIDILYLNLLTAARIKRAKWDICKILLKEETFKFSHHIHLPWTQEILYFYIMIQLLERFL